MITTAFLVRWVEGWHEVNYAPGIARWGRKEATLGLGAVESLSEVETVATQQLRYFSDPLTEIACDYAPRSTHETPVAGFVPGDRIVVPDRPGRPPTRERVQSITATLNDDGIVTYAVELRDVLLTERERFEETLTKMANGTLGGNSKVAQPASLMPALGTKSTAPTPAGCG